MTDDEVLKRVPNVRCEDARVQRAERAYAFARFH
jgi:hypothetical protein